MNSKDIGLVLRALAKCAVIIDRSSTTCCSCRTASAASYDTCNYCGARWKIAFLRDAPAEDLVYAADLLAQGFSQQELFGAVSRRAFTENGELELVQLYYDGAWRERLSDEDVLNPSC